ncbi:MAG: VacJ family lipoprotein [Nitrospirota bacterium]|nr:VacJ family lipoprotein [Nitrospirota bacterium]
MSLLQTPIKRYIPLGLLLLGLGFSTACSNLNASTVQTESLDTIETINRPIYTMNDFIDRNFAEPIAETYIDYTPAPIRHSVSNFFDNVAYLNVILNDFLQGKGQQGLSDSGRFLVNSTFGLFGIWDHATPLGLEKHNEDFGQTLGVWGVGEGSYLVLPFLGPNTVRDAPDLGVSTVTNILFYVSNPIAVPVALLGFIDKRSRFDEAIKFRNNAAVEPYLFTREAYLQHRKFLIFDGDPPIEDDLFPEETFADLEFEDELVSETQPGSSKPEDQVPHSAQKAEVLQSDQTDGQEDLIDPVSPPAPLPITASVR